MKTRLKLGRIQNMKILLDRIKAALRSLKGFLRAGSAPCIYSALRSTVLCNDITEQV